MKKSVKIVLAAAVVAALFLSAFGVGTAGAQSGGADRLVEDGETVFIGEEDIDTGAGVFENLDPGEFTDADGRTLSFSNGVVDSSNAISSYTATDPTGDDLSVNVREARIQRVRPILPGSGARLDFPGTPRVRPGANNVQFAVNYNYFESTEIDEELRQDGTEVTRIYLERSQDRAVTGSRTEAADGTSYDAVFTFSITDTGTYEFVAEPLTGDDRSDGRDVGFGDSDEASGSYTVNVGFEEAEDDEEEGNVTDGEDGDGEMDGDGDGDGEMDGEEDGNVTDGKDGDDGMDGEEDGNVTDGEDGDDGMDGEEDGNVTDGEDGDDGMDGEEDENVTDGQDGDGDGSEGLPGFTAVTALLAITAVVVVVLRRNKGT
jgi:PGF-CTERM protein